MQRTITQTLRLAIGISFFAFILIGINDGAVGVLLPGMQTTYHVGKDTLSLLFLAGTFGYLTASFNNGLLLDKLGNRRFLLLGTLLMGLGFALLSSRPPFVLLLVGIVPIGFGSAMLDAGLNSYIASLPENTARLNYLHAFYGTGALLGPLVASSFLAVGWVWNSVYFVWIGIAILVFIGMGLAFPRRARASQKEEPEAGGNVLFLALRQHVVWLAALFLLFPTTIALMSETLQNRILSSAIGFLASLGSMGGALLPWIAGNLAQHFGLWTLLPYVIALTAIMLVLWVSMQRNIHMA
jgi:fucose permease